MTDYMFFALCMSSIQVTLLLAVTLIYIFHRDNRKR